MAAVTKKDRQSQSNDASRSSDPQMDGNKQPKKTFIQKTWASYQL